MLFVVRRVLAEGEVRLMLRSPAPRRRPRCSTTSVVI